MVQDIKDFGPQLDIKALGYPVIFEHRKIQVNEAWPRNTVTPRIAFKVKACERRQIGKTFISKRERTTSRSYWRRWVAICTEKCRIRCSGQTETLRLDVL